MIIIVDLYALGARIAYYRESMGLSQQDFAKSLNVAQSSLSSLENGRMQTISIQKLEKIATALNVTLDQLLVDSLVKFSAPQKTKPKSFHYLKLKELLQHSTDIQRLILSNFIRYKLKKIEVEKQALQ